MKKINFLSKKAEEKRKEFEAKVVIDKELDEATFYAP